MQKLAVVLMLVAGCGGVVDPDAGRVIGGTGISDDAGSNPAPVATTPVATTPVRNAFDGFWRLVSTIEPRQVIVGFNDILIEVQDGRAVCVTEGQTFACEVNWGRPSSARPITDNGLVLIRFTMDFPLCNYDGISAFLDEKSIEVSIVGSAIAGTKGLVFDVDIKQRYIFSGETVLSKGTLEHDPGDRDNSCGF
ncbi:MAG: hypothetical protein IH987_00030 [Planctomycetes bacterium]|nr:hypothetical protein [Planctomycetota bacterium]